MKNNVVTIIFLFLVIFVTLMFGQDIEQFATIDQTDGTGSSGRVGQGTYYTKENATGVSVFSAMREFSNEINGVANGTAKTTLQTFLEGSGSKDACITNYNNAMNMPTNFWTDNARSYNTLLSAATANPTLKQSSATHATTQANISATNATNKETQQDLDRKMSEMLNDNTGMKLESLTKQNSAMYINIAGTVLATTALYYIFVKI